jgi:hypothetical protein
MLQLLTMQLKTDWTAAGPCYIVLPPINLSWCKVPWGSWPESPPLPPHQLNPFSHSPCVTLSLAFVKCMYHTYSMSLFCTACKSSVGSRLCKADLVYLIYRMLQQQLSPIFLGSVNRNCTFQIFFIITTTYPLHSNNKKPFEKYSCDWQNPKRL